MDRLLRAQLSAISRHVIQDVGTCEQDAIDLARLVLELVADEEAIDRAFEDVREEGAA